MRLKVDVEKNEVEKEQEEMDWNEFFADEHSEEWEKQKAASKNRKKWITKIISSLLAFSLLISGLQVWFNLFNIPAIQFVKVSNRLSKQADVQKYRKAVVTIEWDGVKGTGFNMDPEGLIVTNNHVVGKSKRVNVYFRSGKSYPGKVIATDPEHDLALVDIQANNLPILQLAFDSDWDKWINEKIIFIGNPLSFTQIANEGTVIGKALLDEWDVPVMMVEAPIYRGNSGSPVINKKGRVIGIIFATLQNPQIDSRNIVGAAIPSMYIKTMLEKGREAP